MYPKTHIVIVGGGFGGVACALACAGRFKDRPDVVVSLIHPQPFHEFTPALYVGASSFEDTHCAGHGDAAHTVRSTLCLSLEQIFCSTSVRLVYGWVRSVDRQRQTVTVHHHRPVHYSYLVLALGSTTDYCGVPGLEAHAYPLKTVRDALRVRHNLSTMLNDAHRRISPQKIIIGGGGFTGAELAAEFAWLIRRRKRYAEVVLIEGFTSVLSQLGERASEAARSRLEHLGVALVAGARISAVEGEGRAKVRVSLSNGQSIEGDLLVWTGGVRASRLYQHVFPLYVGAQGRVAVEPTLQVVGEKNVFAIGDGAYLETNEYPKGLPLQARVALSEGKFAAQNIARLMKGVSPIAFSCSPLPYVIPLGGKYGIVVYRARVWRGFLPWAFKQLIELRYYMSVRGWVQGFKLWMQEERMCVVA